MTAPERIAAGFLRFAQVEAPGRSPLYERLAPEVAADPDVARLPGCAARAEVAWLDALVHSAVFPYVAEPARAAFLATVRASRAVWIANEAPGRVPGLDRATVVANECTDRETPCAAWKDRALHSSTTSHRSTTRRTTWPSR